MARRVVITGLGTISAAGIGIESLWAAACEGRSALAPIEAFDASGFGSRIAGEVRGFKANKVVPKSYRKATKVMARDIELAVGAADAAVRDAGLTTPGTDPDAEPTYPGPRSGAHIGAGLIAADIDELTAALVESRGEDGRFDLPHWGREGMMNLTPLWLLKYLPNMLACHVTIIHDAQGPSNTITCAEASGGLSLAESVRAIQRDKADVCYCGGAESKINMMALFRQEMAGRLCTRSNEEPASAVRSWSADAAGSVVGEGGGIVVVEAMDTATARGAEAYAEVLGFAATMSIHPRSGGLEPEPDGSGIAAAIRGALADASIGADEVDAVVGMGSGIPACDAAEAAAIATAFGDRAGDLPLYSVRPVIGNCGAGGGGIDLAMAAMMLGEQAMPPRLNIGRPLDGIAGEPTTRRDAELGRVLVVSPGLGGQNVAVLLGKAEA